VTLASAVLELHRWWAWVVVVSTGLAGSWALVAHLSPAIRRRELWWFTAAAHASVFVQAGLGSWLIAREDRDAPDLHALYGFSLLAAVGIIYSYRQQLREHVYLLYGGGGLFLMGMGIRALIT
jgi:hypothetical protein